MVGLIFLTQSLILNLTSFLDLCATQLISMFEGKSVAAALSGHQCGAGSHPG